MAEEMKLGSGKVRIVLPEMEPWEVDPLRLMGDVDAIEKQCEADKKTIYEFLAEVVALINSEKYGGPLLEPAQADELVDELRGRHVLKKKMRSDAIDSKLKSPSFTG